MPSGASCASLADAAVRPRGRCPALSRVPAVVPRRPASAVSEGATSRSPNCAIGFGPFHEKFVSRVELDARSAGRSAHRDDRDRGPVPPAGQPLDVPAASRRHADRFRASSSNSARCCCSRPSGCCSPRRSSAWSRPSRRAPTSSTASLALGQRRQHRQRGKHRDAADRIAIARKDVALGDRCSWPVRAAARWTRPDRLVRRVPPPGPATPVTDTARSAPERARAPAAMARATGSLTAPWPSRASHEHAQHLALGLVGIGDEGALDDVGRARDRRQGGGDQAAGAGLWR